jgi:hypothetical protein
MHCSLVEVGESGIRNLGIGVDWNDRWGLVSFVSNKVTAYEVEGCLGKSNHSWEFLFKSVGDRLEREHAFFHDHSARVDAEYAVHVPLDFVVGEGLHAGILAVLDVLLRLDELLVEFDTRVSENYALEADKLSFLKLDVDDAAGISDDDYLTVFVLLFDREARFRYYFFAGVHPRCQPYHTVLFCEI